MSENPNAIHLIEEYLLLWHHDSLSVNAWINISAHPNATALLIKFPEKVEMDGLSRNPNVRLIIKELSLITDTDENFYYNSIEWSHAAKNPNIMDLRLNDEESASDMLKRIGFGIDNFTDLAKNSSAIPLLEVLIADAENNPSIVIDWVALASNPKAGHLIPDNATYTIGNYWTGLSENPSPDVIKLLGNNKARIDICTLARNTNRDAYDILIAKYNEPNTIQDLSPNAIKQLWDDILANPIIFEEIKSKSNSLI